MRQPFLCHKCHTPHGGNLAQLMGQGQPSALLSATSGGKSGINYTQGRGCLNCHTQVHGSNNPARRTRLRNSCSAEKGRNIMKSTKHLGFSRTLVAVAVLAAIGQVQAQDVTGPAELGQRRRRRRFGRRRRIARGSACSTACATTTGTACFDFDYNNRATLPGAVDQRAGTQSRPRDA